MNTGQRDGFSSKFGVFAAATGSAIGLGNIWRFPYVVGENGGAAFLLIYLGFVFLIGIPVMLSEFTIGRKAQLNAYGSFKKLAPGKPWYIVGLMGIVAAFTILAFYSTVAGWTLEYVYQSFVNLFANRGETNPANVFNEFHTGTTRPLLWQLLFMVLTAGIILGGVKKGIEKYSKILMPVLFLILVILCVRSLTLPGAAEGLAFLFRPDFTKINADVILNALGQAAFSLSIGMGALITYGSYIRKNNNLTKTAFQVSIADLTIAILAGVAIFPAVFAFNVAPEAGAGLVFIVLPSIFQQMAGGAIFEFMFFILLTIAALTSSISILEVVVAYFVEEFKIKRVKATFLATFAIAIVGVFATLSFSSLSNFKIFNLTIFDSLDFLSANILLPLGALLIVLFLAYFYPLNKTKEEISNNGKLKLYLFSVYVFVIKFLAPIAITIVFLKGIGLF
jgi:neurotransmitter:Na+ symporter, NSS family